MIASNAWRFFISLLLITAGILFFLDNFGFIQVDVVNIFFTYWPIIILYAGLMFVIRGLKPLITRRKVHEPNLIIGGILLFFGWNFQANLLNLPAIEMSTIWKAFWPLLIIYIGFRILFRKKRTKPRYQWDGPDEQNGNNTWVGEIKIGDKPFELEDKNYWTGIGSTDLNLTKAIFPDRETVLHVEGWVGEINVYLPPDIPIKVEGEVNIGAITILGEEQGGISKNVAYKSKGFDEANKRAVLNISLVVGEIRVVQV